MTKIIAEAEKQYPLAIKDKRPAVVNDSDTFYSDAICIHAGKTAEEASAEGLIGLTASGYTAFKLSSFRPSCPIYIFSDRDHMLKTLNLCWGVKCLFYDKFTSTDETIEDLIDILKKKQYLKEGDVVVNTGSMPLHKRQRTNFLKITKVE